MTEIVRTITVQSTSYRRAGGTWAAESTVLETLDSALSHVEAMGDGRRLTSATRLPNGAVRYAWEGWSGVGVRLTDTVWIIPVR